MAQEEKKDLSDLIVCSQCYGAIGDKFAAFRLDSRKYERRCDICGEFYQSCHRYRLVDRRKKKDA